MKTCTLHTPVIAQFVYLFVLCSFFFFVGNHCLTFPYIVFTFCNHIFSIVLTLLFNSVLIQGTDSVMDDCLYHLVCPCCTLSQESRTLQINNVQDGTWHGRGDTICVGAYNEGNNSILELCAPPVMSIQSSEPSIMAIT